MTENTETWARVEIFGHRQHYGRITEVERFGAKMLCVEVPQAEPGEFTTHFYGGASIFSLTPITEQLAREMVERYAPREYRPAAALPAPDYDPDDDDGGLPI